MDPNNDSQKNLWEPTSVKEVHLLLSILIYMGLYKQNTIMNY
jgi:hypothetical protein